MEPASVQTTEGKRKGRGSLESPELYENVPGHVIPILEREFDDFDSEASTFLAGNTEETEFIGFRLKQGVYGQRQADVQMIRVKLPFGGVTPSQMDAFADVIEKYAPLNKGHITTRQNIQIHHVPLTDAAKLIRELGDAGLSSREGCGNTVRNVTGDPWAGVSHDEPFDPTPYAGAFVRYFVRNDVCQLLPRKFKVAFTASDEDRAITGIHDLGLIPRVREVERPRGARLRDAGGRRHLDHAPHRAVPVRVRGDRGRRLPAGHRGDPAHLRPPGVAAGQPCPRPHQGAGGQDRHRRLPRAGRRGAARRLGGRARLLAGAAAVRRRRAGRRAAGARVLASPNGDRSRFDAFHATNVRPQRQDGFSTVEVKVTRGDLTPDQLRSLADVMREFSGGYARTTVHQNLLLRWVRDEAIYDVWRRLEELGLGGAGADEITDVVSCPGTDSCKLGITSSMGLNQAVQERLEHMQIDDPLTRRIHIKMSGCPNGCSQHHIANIGFYGASIKVGDKTIPAYVAHLGGNYEGGTVRMGTRLKVRLPAKRVPDAVERWVRHYEAGRQEGEAFNDFVARVGEKEFEDVVRDLAMPVEFSLDTMNHFIDWNRGEPFKVVRGEGECAV